MKKDFTIVNLEPYGFSAAAEAKWKTIGEYYRIEDEINSPPSVKDSATVLIVRLKNFIGRKFLNDFPSLRWIISATTGHDHIELSELERRNIKLVSLREDTEFLKSIPSTAEHTWALLLSLVRKIHSAFQSVHQGQWSRDSFRGNQLKGKILGIIGMGRTGSKVADYARAFGMTVHYYDPFVSNAEGIKAETLEQLLTLADVVSIHVHLTENTRHLLNNQNCRHIKSGAFLINTSRSGVWDENVLASMLKSGAIAGIATDVLDQELSDISSSELYAAAKQGYNILITPHLGGATWEAMHSCEEYIAEKFITQFAGRVNAM